MIDMSDVTTADPQEKDNQFLSRALAAFCIADIARIDDALAAQSVVDEYHDDGIDGFYFDRVEHIAYLVQSKWSKNGTGGIDVSTVHKFCAGVNHLLENKITLLGPKMQAKANDIQDALADSQATFVLIIAYTSKGPISPDARKPLDELLQALNDDGDLVSFREMKQKELHDIVEQRALGDSVDLQIMLHEFGHVQIPYNSYYGQIAVMDIATWGQHGDRLYHRNIRGFKGSTDVNDAIVSTIKNHPENFLYFNNGITLLCSELKKQPLGGKSKDSGVFECKGASVVNGAQTVGSIISALAASGSTSTARVMLRLISLEDCPSDFGSDVTRAANTQNRIEKKDFAALDPEQQRLRSELLLSLGKDYVFRTGDQSPDPDKGCTIDEATVALACAQSDATHAVNAKQAIGRFYEDISKPPYTILFNPSLTAIKLWRAVEMLRAVDNFLKQEQKNRDGKEKLCAIHGNRVMLHLVFRDFPDLFDAGNANAYVAKIPTVIPVYIDKMAAELTKNYAVSYVGNVFKNITKCKAIVAAIA
jgi:hypothetical protein